MMGGRTRINSPGKWAVVRHQHSWTRVAIRPLQRAYDRSSGFFLVIACDSLVRQIWSHRNRTMEIVCVRGTKTGDGFSGLRPGRGVLGMSVGDAANLAESVV